MKRDWTIEADETGTPNAREVAEAMVEAGAILNRIGGVLVVGADRAEDEHGVFTARIMFHYDSFVPTRMAGRDDGAPAEDHAEPGEGDAEAAAVARYEAALASGLSDAEARAEGWPLEDAEQPAAAG